MKGNEDIELRVSVFRRNALKGSIKKIRAKIQANGMAAKEVARCLSHIAYLTEELGEAEEAIKTFRQALRFDPDNSMAKQALDIQ
ncbi:MAG: hypothetical protein NT116_03685 [Candidatus Parcubacteria bacterium]|nr:hypothetical protein [Candidatus Parcubacteria bacterium]